MPFAALNGTELYYEVDGQGAPLVFIHAGICDCRMWEQQVSAFAEKYQVIRYDLRGHGRSKLPDGQFAFHTDLAALLDQLNVTQPVILIGASRGGRIALDFTLTYPDRVQALVMVCSSPSGYPATEAMQQKFAQIDEVLERGDLARAVELELELWVAGPGRTQNQVDEQVWELVREMNTSNFMLENQNAEPQPIAPLAIDRLSEVKAPLLLIVGQYDLDGNHAAVDLMVQQVAGAQKVVMPDTAHLPSLERPGEFNQMVLNFLSDK